MTNREKSGTFNRHFFVGNPEMTKKPNEIFSHGQKAHSIVWKKSDFCGVGCVE